MVQQHGEAITLAALKDMQYTEATAKEVGSARGPVEGRD